MNRLPPEILLLIFEKVNPTDWMKIMRVCRQVLASNSLLWENAQWDLARPKAMEMWLHCEEFCQEAKLPLLGLTDLRVSAREPKKRIYPL